MSAMLRAYLSWGYWRHALPRFVASLFVALGVLWTLTELLLFFQLAPTLVSWLKERWWLFLLAGAAWAVWENRPRHVVGCILTNRDVRIEVRVGDLFSGDHALVIGCNASFDTDMASGIISGRSVQGQFTERYYSNVAHLDADIGAALSHPSVPQPTQERKAGKQSVYPIGTTLTVRPQGRTTYLCAIARMNAKGNAHATFEDIKRALPELWDHISSAGDHGDIAVPILGSGLARVAENRPTLIREILRSFIAACAAQRPCSSLTVVVRPEDYYRLNMDLKELGDFLTHLCKYTDFAAAGALGGGQPMPAAPVLAATGVVTVQKAP